MSLCIKIILLSTESFIMKKVLLIFSFLWAFESITINKVDKIGKTANDDMAAAMHTTLISAGAVLGCSILGKGIKASFDTTKNLDEKISNQVIMGACASLYAYFVASAVFIHQQDGENINKVTSDEMRTPFKRS